MALNGVTKSNTPAVGERIRRRKKEKGFGGGSCYCLPAFRARFSDSLTT